MPANFARSSSSPEELPQAFQLLRAVIDKATDGYFVKDSHGHYLYCNGAVARFYGRSISQIIGHDDFALFGPELATNLTAQDRHVLETQSAQTLLHAVTTGTTSSNLEFTTSPFLGQDGTMIAILGEVRDVSKASNAEWILRRQQGILENIAKGAPLEQILGDLVAMIEQELPGSVGSFLLLDQDGTHLHVAAAQSLPPSYNAAIEGMKIGPNAGSCGTAAFLGQKVFVFDIANDPLWVDFRDLALPHGLRACWSIPICSRSNSNNSVLGTFAVYSRQPALPDQHLDELISRIEYLACIAIENHRTIQNLSASEGRFRTIVENCAEAVFMHDQNGMVVDVNQQACIHLGYSRSELIGLSPIDFDPTITSATLQSILMVLDQGKRITFETSHQRKDGTVIPVEVRLSPFYRNNLRNAIASVHDISDRKSAETQQRRQQQSLNDAQSLAHLGSFDWNMLTNQVTWSDELYRIYGYEPQEVDITLERFLSHIYPDDLERVQKTIQHACQSADSYRIEERILRPDGTVRTLESLGNIVRDDSGQPIRIIGACLDITDRKNSEDIVRASEERYRSLITAMAEGVVFQAANLEILTCNAAAEKILGLTADQICGRASVTPGWKSIYEDGSPFPPEAHPALETLRTGKPSQNVVMGIQKPDGRLTWISINTEPLLRTGETQPYGVVFSFSDITEQKQAEDELRESEQRLRLSLQAASAIAFVWDVPTDSVVRYYSTEPSLPANPGRPEPIANIRAQIHPDDQAIFDAGIMACFSQGTEYRNLYRVIRPDTTIRWLEVRGTLERDPCGAPLRLLGVSIDVTERKLAESRLEENQRFSNAMIQATPECIKVLDENGVILLMNQTGQLMIGASSPQDAIGKNVLDLVVPIDHPAYVKFHQRVLQGESATLEFDIVTLHGDRRTMESHAVPVNINGRSAHLAVTRDITDKIRAQKELRETAELLRAVADGTTDSIFVKEHNGRYLFVNEAAVTVIGKPSTEILNQDDTSLFDAESATEIMQRDRQVMASGQVYTGEEIATAQGVTRTFHSTKAPYHDEQGKIIGIIGISRDITDRKAVERALQLTQFSIDRAVDSIFWINPAGEILYVNDAVTRTLGYSREELIGSTVSDIDPNFPKEAWPAHWEEVKQRGSFSFESDHATKDGRVLKTEVTVNYLQYDGQEYNCAVMRDITQEKHLAEQLRQSQKMEAIGRLAGGVAHDFNNLLTVINGYSEMMLDGMPTVAPGREQLTAIREAGERAASLTAQLLAFSRKAIVETKLLDLNKVVESAVQMLRRLIEEDIELTVTLAPFSIPVKAAPVHLEQVIMNLALNARDAMPSGGQLLIETSNVTLSEADVLNSPNIKPGPYACLQVKDTGHGMTDDVKEKIFEPFFTTKGVGKGTGLGLAVVHGVVNQCGGYIEVDSAPNAGTTFRIYIPRAMEVPTLPTVSPLPTKAEKVTETILLVEDENQVRTITRIALEKTGAKVLEAASGPLALKLLDEYPGPIHLLITDVVMPGMGGRQVVELARARLPNLPVLYISGYTDDAVVQRGLVEKSEAFLQKPFTPQVLVKKVRSILNKATT